jgi:diaminohydroxyphosphoribosylaminopyrimidine deaminase / 5-amino-6-(5-phosphoribosylamino)uracil reductase
MKTGRISAGVEPAAPVLARERTGEAPAGVPGLGPDAAWRLLLAVRAAVDAGHAPGELAFAVAGGEVRRGPDGAATVVVDRRACRVAQGLGRFGPPARELLELFLVQAVTPREAGSSVAILGQTLDGFIATRSGDSRYINGSAALVHLHRARALCDAVIVGASTAVLDEPRLTTRHVEGPNAVRVVVDPNGRLPATSPLLHDGAAPTLVLRRGEGREREEPVTDQARVLRLPESLGQLAPVRIVAALRERGLGRLLVEGGGDTAGRFLACGRLDGLQLLVAPILLGGGRPAVRLPPAERLAGALRPACRRYLMGEDVLFDLRLSVASGNEDGSPD